MQNNGCMCVCVCENEYKYFQYLKDIEAKQNIDPLIRLISNESPICILLPFCLFVMLITRAWIRTFLFSSELLVKFLHISIETFEPHLLENTRCYLAIISY